MKSMLQAAEAQMPAQLAIVDSQLDNVFGEKYKDLFVTVSPREFLFDGMRFCVDPVGIARIVCSVVKAKNVKAIRELEDGSVKFALLYQVINNTMHIGHRDKSRDLYHRSANCFVEKRVARRTVRHVHGRG